MINCLIKAGVLLWVSIGIATKARYGVGKQSHGNEISCITWKCSIVDVTTVSINCKHI